MTRARSVLSVTLTGLLALAASSCAANDQKADTPSASSTQSAAQPSSSPVSTQAGSSVGESGTATASSSASSASPAETTPGEASATSAPPSSSTPSASSSASGEATPVAINAEITAVSQIPTKLSATSKEFQAYLTKIAKNSAKTPNGTTCPNFQLSVYQYWPSNDQATGGMSACGGYEAIWYTDPRGVWQEYGFQSVPYCSVLRAEGVPHAIAVADGFGCIEKGSGEVVSYQQAP